MEAPPITFDQLPDFVYRLSLKFDNLNEFIRSQSTQSQSIPDRWFSIEELSEYLPGHPAVTTLYGKVQRREIPFNRKGKRLSFLKSEIDSWLQSGRVKTSAELSVTAEQHHLNNKKTVTRRKGANSHV